jgi:hypothetical protein
MCQIDAWIAELRAASFAGAVAVPEDALASIATEARAVFLTNTPSDRARACYLLLAFNCAYYRFEHDFWPQMFALLELPHDLQAENRARDALELAWPRVLGCSMPTDDPQWKQVGAVLGETGIVRSHLPQFALILGSSESNWRRHIEASLTSFRALPEHLGARLRRFLDTREGWQFTRDVARLLLGWREGRWTREALDSAAGFRPGFFGELLTFLHAPSVAPGREPRVPAPRIVFDTVRELPVVLFASEAIGNGECVIGGKRVYSSAHPLAFVAEYREALQWQTRDRSGGLVFWKPSPSRPCALFHPSRGFIPHGQTVAPGAHVLLARDDFSAPGGVRVLSEFSLAAVEDERLRWWMIEVPEDGVRGLPGYAPEQSMSAKLWLEWANDACLLDGAADVRSVFIEQLPSAWLCGAESLPEGWRAFAELDGRECRVEVRGNQLELAGPMAKPPFRGSIWIEYVGRLRADSTLPPRLDFAVIPQTRIAWPPDLYSPSEQPEVAVSGPCAFTLQQAEKVRENLWRIEPSVSCAEGTLDFENVRIGLAKRIWRARCTVSDQAEYALDLPAMLRAERVQFAGLPETAVRIGFAAGYGATTAVLNAGVFGSSGTFECRGAALIDALRDWPHPVALVCVHDGNRWVETDVRVFNPPAVEQWIIECEGADEPSSFVRLSESERRSLLHFRKALQEAAIPPCISPAEFSSGVRALLAEFGWIADVFRTVGNPRSELPPLFEGGRAQWIAIADWMRDALPFLRGEKSDEDSIAELRIRGEALDVESLPLHLPWRARLAAAVASLVSIKEMLIEWESDVRIQGQVPRSKIAGLSQDMPLTTAWRRWLHFSAPQAFGECEQAAQSSHFLVRSLALLLRAVILLRSEQLRAEDAAEPADCPGVLKCYFTAIRTGEPVALEVTLPLPDRDLDLIRRGWRRLHPPQ